MINLLFLRTENRSSKKIGKDNMNDFSIHIYDKSEEIPTLIEGNFFHSKTLFQIIEKAPNDTPYMAVISQDGEVKGQMLVIIHRRGSLIPPYLFTHAHVHGEGCYAEDANVEELFPLLLKAVTLKLRHRLCFYIEFSELQKKMFGYRYFRRLGYSPIPWQEIHNSLHDKAPEKRLSSKRLDTILRMSSKGVTFHEATTISDIIRFHTLLRNFYRFKPRRCIPSKEFFLHLAESQEGKIFLTTYKNKVIGGCACIYSQGNAYLWYAAAKRKSRATLHPHTMVIWHAIQHAYTQGCTHFTFMDIGLPWKQNQYREFILSFGGKPITKFRWFRFYPRIINSILHWLYKD